VAIGVLFGLQFSIWTSQIPLNLREVFDHKSCLVANHQSILIFFVVVACDCLVLEFVVGLCNQLGLVLVLKVLRLLNVLEELSCLLLHPHYAS
jgi:hypothetical protein